MEFTLRVAEDGSGYGLGVSNRGGYAFVSKASGSLQIDDRITHVAGNGPLDHDSVLSALKAKPSPVDVVVIRGERPPSVVGYRKSSSSNWWFTFSWLLIAPAVIATLVLDPGNFSSVTDIFNVNLTEAVENAKGRGLLPRHMESQAGESAVRRPPERRKRAKRTAPVPDDDDDDDDDVDDDESETRGPPAVGHLVIGGTRFDVTDDGTPLDPDGMRAAMRADAATMAQFREHMPEYAKTVIGNPDGSYNKPKFIKLVQDNVWGARAKESLELNEDGTAKKPDRYIQYLLKEPGRKYLKEMKKNDPEAYKGIVDRKDPEALQSYLRQMTLHREQQKMMDEAPPNPPTPYDDIGRVGMSMRILTDEGEEKDLYQLAAEETEEEQWTMPPYMLCPACEASSFQAAKAVAHALATKYNDELTDVVAIDAMQELCRNVGLFTEKYGVTPTSTGQNYIEGEGVTKTETSLEGAGDLMLANMHSDKWGRKLAESCQRFVLGADLEIDEIVALSQEETAKGSENSGAARFQELFCRQPGQPCAPQA